MTEQISTPPKESLPAVPLFDSLTIHHWPSLFSHDWTLNPQHLTLSKYSKQLLLHRMNVFLLNFQLLASPISLLNSSDTICLIAKLPHNSSTDLKPLRNKTKKSSKLEKKDGFPPPSPSPTLAPQHWRTIKFKRYDANINLALSQLTSLLMAPHVSDPRKLCH